MGLRKGVGIPRGSEPCLLYTGPTPTDLGRGFPGDQTGHHITYAVRAAVYMEKEFITICFNRPTVCARGQESRAKLLS